MKTITFTFILFLLCPFVATHFTLVGPCECGIFFANRFEKKSNNTPILIHTINYNICNIAGENLCKSLCISANKVTKPEDIDVICKAIGNGSNILLKILSKSCGDKWINTDLFSTEPLCCSKGQDVICERAT